MKTTKPVLLLACLLAILFSSQVLFGDIKWVRVGKLHQKIQDNCGESKGGDIGPRQYSFYYYDGFNNWNFRRKGWSFGVKDWTDKDGQPWDYYIMGPNLGKVDDFNIEIPQRFPDDGSLIKRYYRYAPPKVIVDGAETTEPFPRTGDELDPDKILGTADIMVESVVNTELGLTINQRVLAYSQADHDDYIVWDMIWTNTGNTDSDPEIELEGQTLDSLYYFRYFRFTPTGGVRPTWNNYYGARTSDTLRVVYGYNAWDEGQSYDSYGQPDMQTGYITKPQRAGWAFLFASKSPAEPDVNDPAQPRMTCSTLGLDPPGTAGQDQSPEEMAEDYNFFQYGAKVVPEVGAPYIQDPVSEGGLGVTDHYPGTHHGVMVEDLEDAIYPTLGQGWIWGAGTVVSYMTCGPYTLGPGESVRVVWAEAFGTISPKKSWEVGKAWLAGECTWDGPDKLPPPAARVYASDGNTWSGPAYKAAAGLDDNDIAKDNWISTGTDSLFANANAAQWAFDHEYIIPMPPPPPEFMEVTSLPDMIKVEWGTQSETGDFAGYRVYRAKGDFLYSEEPGVPIGDWELVFDCGEGTENALTHTFEDTDAVPGADYYYAVTAFDDGSGNVAGVRGVSESLESSRIQCRSIEPASLLKEPAAGLDSIRVVPNPYNVNAEALQFPGSPDKINFVNLPGVCTIKIFNVSGDLIKTIEHTDYSGYEAWVTETGYQYMTSETGQIVVSGVYIANITTPDGKSANVKFIIVR